MSGDSTFKQLVEPIKVPIRPYDLSLLNYSPTRTMRFNWRWHGNLRVVTIEDQGSAH